MSDINRQADGFFSKEAGDARKAKRATKKEQKQINLYGDTAAHSDQMGYLQNMYMSSSAGTSSKTPLFIAGGILVLMGIIAIVLKTKK